MQISNAFDVPLPPQQAAWIASEVADLLVLAHDQGHAHGRLNPEAVLLDDLGAVRVIGFGVDAALHGIDPDTRDSQRRDRVDAVGVLYAALTGKWAGETLSSMPPAPRDHGRVLRPRQVRAGVPRPLDDLCDRVLGSGADMPPLTAEDTLDMLGHAGEHLAAANTQDAEYVARTVQALADGRPCYARAISDELAAMREHGGSDAISALSALMGRDGRLSRQCNFCYELRLHRARGYGALKAILEILAEEEPLTLTEIALRLHRTPGSTKDYLSWLEDVDLVVARHVQGEQQSRAHALRERGDPLEERLSLVGERELGALAVKCTRNAPCDAALVRHAHDQGALTFQQHWSDLPSSQCSVSRPARSGRSA